MSVTPNDLLVSAFATLIATGVTSPIMICRIYMPRAITATAIYFSSLSDADHTYHKYHSCGKPKHPVK